MAAVERAVTDGSDRVRYVDGGESFAAGESAVADGSDGARNFNCCRTAKISVQYASILRQDKVFRTNQLSAVIKRLYGQETPADIYGRIRARKSRLVFDELFSILL